MIAQLRRAGAVMPCKIELHQRIDIGGFGPGFQYAGVLQSRFGALPGFGQGCCEFQVWVHARLPNVNFR